MKWALGWSDETGTAPTVVGGDFDLPDTRSWITFEAFMKTFPFTFAQNAPVRSEVSMQLSGEPNFLPRTTS
jgi:hypothetical protein